MQPRNMIELVLFVALLAVHYVGDFICQTHWQASNKSKRFDALARHVASYTFILFIGVITIFGCTIFVLAFVTVNAIAHFVTDFFTSRWSSRLYAKQDWHNFFVVIGLDQLIHQVTLAGTFAFFLGSI